MMTTLTPDHQLLERYLREGDQLAFAALVESFLPLVQCAALRVARDQTLAEEASQIVFTRLSGLRRYPFASLPLVVWLHRTTRSVAIDLVRSEASRRKREQAAALAMSAPSDFPWERIAPLLDHALGQLSASDRYLILARYFQGESHADVAQALGLTMEAAKKRTARALEKLRALLGRRGVTTTAAVLALTLPAHASAPVASAQVMSIATTALKSAAASATISATPVVPFVTAKVAMKAAAAVILVSAAIPIALSMRSHGPAAAARAPVAESHPLTRVPVTVPEEAPATADLRTTAGSQGAPPRTAGPSNAGPAKDATNATPAESASAAGVERFSGPSAASPNTNLGPAIARPAKGTTLVGSQPSPQNHE